MRLVVFETDVVDTAAHVQVKAGSRCVLTRGLLRHYASLCDGYMSVEKYPYKAFDPACDWNGKRILVHRIGGAGDLLFITPLLRAIKEKWPQCHLAFQCGYDLPWVFADNPHVDQCLAPPLTVEQFESYDAHLNLEDVIEYSPLAKTLTAVDVFAAAAGIELLDKKPLFRVSPALVRKLDQRFPKKTRRVGLALRSNAAVRDYPPEQFMPVMGRLMESGIQVVLLGAQATGAKPHPLFIDLPGVTPALSWAESIAFMKTCDLVLGPDSGNIHFAGAMDVPSLGIYGSFPAELRVATQRMTRAIQATGPCAPCFHHCRKETCFPPDGPCRKSHKCEVLASITPKQIITKIMDLLAGEAAGSPQIVPAEPAPKI